MPALTCEGRAPGQVIAASVEVGGGRVMTTGASVLVAVGVGSSVRVAVGSGVIVNVGVALGVIV